MTQFVLPKASLYILTHPDGEQTPCSSHEEALAAICAESAYTVEQVPATGIVYNLELHQHGNIIDLGTFESREVCISLMQFDSRQNWDHPDFRRCEWMAKMVEVFADGENTEVPESDVTCVIASIANFED
jgi:hypothetical protein